MITLCDCGDGSYREASPHLHDFPQLTAELHASLLGIALHLSQSLHTPLLFTQQIKYLGQVVGREDRFRQKTPESCLYNEAALLITTGPHKLLV